MATSTVLVTGATGLLGGEALRRMLAADPAQRAFVLVRDPARWPAHARARGIDPTRVDAVRGDLTLPGLGLDLKTRARLLARIDAVVHAAADTEFSRPLAAARAINTEGTRRVVALAAECARPVRLTYVSTAYVAGRSTGRIAEADAPHALGFVNAYEQSKAEAERVVRAYSGDWRIARPSTVVWDAERRRAPQQNAVHRALRLCWLGLAPMLPGTPATPVDLVTADYAAEGIARVALADDVARRTVHLCAGDGAIPLAELLERCWRRWSRDAGWRRRTLSMPALAPLETFRLFTESVRDTGDARLARVLGSLDHFAPQLALPKTFDTTNADALVGRAATPVRLWLHALLDHLLATGWSAAARRAA